ncbi:MAG: hypothetical protein HY321_21225 [Armatimonadetes bacterium]|nr:hypothetical protein [Armatimonadota bacterium]
MRGREPGLPGISLGRRTRSYFPFRALGFHCNPFRALTREEWMALALLPEPIRAAGEQGGAHVQVIGDKGRGKTSALLALTASLRRRGLRASYEYLAEGERRFRTEARDLDVFLLDEAWRLSRRERHRLVSLARRGVRLVLSSHPDLAPWLARRGVPALTVNLNGPDEAHFEAVLAARLAHFALDGEGRVGLSPGAVRWLREVFGTDLRAAEELLYEVFQRLPPPGPLTANRLRQERTLIAAEAAPSPTAGCGAG